MINKADYDELQKYLSDITKMHNRIGTVDKSIEKMYPIAIVKNNVFYVFDYDNKNKEYVYQTEGEIPGITMPSKILAAFQLPFYDGKACAVITDNEIRIPANHIFIFHEFVH